MWQFIGLTMVTGVLDSLNPIALGQQLVLQGMVKRRGHIWLYILGTGLTNFIGGCLVYFGLLAPLLKGIAWLWLHFANELRWGAKGVGVLLCLMGIGVTRQWFKQRSHPNDASALQSGKSYSAQTTIVSPLALLGLGSLATLFELSTALPYFAFLGLLFQAELSGFGVMAILVLYNLLYMLPLMLLYLVYVYFEQKAERFLSLVQQGIARLMVLLKPVVLIGLGLFLLLI